MRTNFVDSKTNHGDPPDVDDTLKTRARKGKVSRTFFEHMLSNTIDKEVLNYTSADI